MARYQTLSYTTGSVSANSSLTENKTGFPNTADLVRIKITPNTAGGSARAQIFGKDTFATTDLMYNVGPFTGAMIDPLERNTALERNQFPVCMYEDRDATNELHIKYFNDDSQAKTYAIEVDFIEQLGQLARVASNFDKTNNTLADVTGLTAWVGAAGVYRFLADLFTTSNVAAGVKFAIAGTATATEINYEGLLNDAAAANITQSRSTSLGTAVAAVTAVTAGSVRIVGTIKVNAAGTLTVQFAQNVTNAAASTVIRGSSFEVMRIQ